MDDRTREAFELVTEEGRRISKEISGDALELLILLHKIPNVSDEVLAKAANLVSLTSECPKSCDACDDCTLTCVGNVCPGASEKGRPLGRDHDLEDDPPPGWCPKRPENRS